MEVWGGVVFFLHEYLFSLVTDQRSAKNEHRCNKLVPLQHSVKQLQYKLKLTTALASGRRTST